MPFELNYSYYLYVFLKKKVKHCFKYQATNELTKKLENLMVIYRKTFNIIKNCKNKLRIKVRNR